jgi:hypothetical protein
VWMFKTDHKLRRELPKVINTDHHQKPVCAGSIGLRSRPKLPPLSSTATPDGLSSPRWGRFFDSRSRFWSRGPRRLLLSDCRWRRCWSRSRPRSGLIRPSNDPRYYWLLPRKRTPTQASHF